MKWALFTLLIFQNLLANDFVYKLKEIYFTSKEIHFNAKQSEDMSINIIPNTWVNIIRINTIENNLWCLNFRSPWKVGTQMKKHGELTLVQKEKCEDSFYDPPAYKFETIEDFKVQKNAFPKRLQLIINAQSVELKTFSNTEVYTNKNLKDSKIAIGAKYISNDKDLVICHDFNKQCNELVKNKCDLCRYGWFEGAASECNGKRVKYCGVANCGGRNLPACYRGDSHTQIKGLLGCQNGSLSGFCNIGLEVFCENGQLFCR